MVYWCFKNERFKVNNTLFRETKNIFNYIKFVFIIESLESLLPCKLFLPRGLMALIEYFRENGIKACSKKESFENLKAFASFLPFLIGNSEYRASYKVIEHQKAKIEK